MSALTLLLEHAAEVARTHGSDVEINREIDAVHACEEALRLGLRFDEAEERTLVERLVADETAARQLSEEEQAAVDAVNAQLTSLCQKDEDLARKLDAELSKEQDAVQKLEARERKLAQKKLLKGDYEVAAALAADIEAEERAIERREARDRQLARDLVRAASQGLSEVDDETKRLSNEINGKAPPPSMRNKLRQKLGLLKGNMSDITNQIKASPE